MVRRLILSIGASACLATPAMAQTNLVYNGGFEILGAPQIFGPRGWQAYNGPVLSTVTAVAHTGDNCVVLPTNALNTFVGVSSDLFGNNGAYFWSPITIPGGGDITVKGWYMIPTETPLTGCNAGLKLEFKRDNLSEFTARELLTVNGTTNGQWRQMSMTVTEADLNAIALAFPPGPVGVAVLAIRFGPSLAQSGTVYWDDLELFQGNPCPADYDGNGLIEPADVASFVSAWFSSLVNGNLIGDFDHNGAVEPADVAAFVSAWFAALTSGHCP